MIREPVPEHDGSPSDEAGAPLRDLLAALRLRTWSILGITAIVVASALFFSLRQTPVYQSEAKVLVKPVTVGSAPQSGGAPNLETERVLAGSVAVAKLVIKELALGETPRALLAGVEVSVSANTEILLIRYVHKNAREAQRRAQAFAESYLEFRRQQALDDLLAASASVQGRIQRLNRDLEQVNRQIARARSESERNTLQQKANLLLSQLAVLQQKLSELTPAENIRVGEIVEPASLPQSPVSPNHLLDLALALLVGLALGLGVAFLRERVDVRLRGRRDLERQAGAPVLAVVPHVGEWKRVGDTYVVTLSEPRSAPSEAYRMLRAGLLFLATQQELKIVMVTSARPGEGKSVTVANLAVALAQADKRVVAFSADLRKPRLHRFFGLGNERGLTNVLAGEIEPSEALLHPYVAHMGVIASGPIPGNADLLTSQAMGELLSELKREADFVIVDVPPVLAVSDALALTPFADGVLLVADGEHTSRHAVAQARHQLDQMNARVVGTVLNNFDPSRARAYPAHYQYYYPYRYEREDSHGGRRNRPGGSVSPDDALRGWVRERGIEDGDE